MITGHKRGHKTIIKNVRQVIFGDYPTWSGDEYYADTGELADYDRSCHRCGKMPTKEGYDACLGYIPGANHACCGHGVGEGYVIIKGFRSKIDDIDNLRKKLKKDLTLV